VLARSDAATVMSLLARAHADVQGPVTDPRFGTFGFYCGVTNTVVGLQVTFDREGFNGVENFLRFGRTSE